MLHHVIEVRQKLWGETRCIDRGPHHEAWVASAKAGGFSSRHIHRHKDNTFYVISGEIRIRLYNHDGDQLEVHALTPGQCLTVAAGEPHRFEAVTAATFVETYARSDGGCINFDDIVRADVGGIKED